MPEHQQPHRDPALAPANIPDDGDEEYTLLIESQDVEHAGPEDQGGAGDEDELDDDVEDDDEEDEEDDVEGKFDETLTRLPLD